LPPRRSRHRGPDGSARHCANDRVLDDLRRLFTLADLLPGVLIATVNRDLRGTVDADRCGLTADVDAGAAGCGLTAGATGCELADGDGDDVAPGAAALRSASLPVQLATTIPVITAVRITSAIPIAVIFQGCQ